MHGALTKLLEAFEHAEAPVQAHGGEDGRGEFLLAADEPVALTAGVLQCEERHDAA